MFDNLSYTTRNYLLIAGSVIFAFIVYNNAIQKTLDVKSKYDTLKQQIQSNELSVTHINQLQAESNTLNTILGTTKEAEEDIQQNLLEEVSEYCNKNKITLTKFPETTSFREKEYIIETNEFEVKGTFKKLLQLQYNIENNFKGARVASVHYYSKKNIKTKELELFLNVYLQNIKKVDL